LSLAKMRQLLDIEHRSLEGEPESSDMTAQLGVKAAFNLTWEELDGKPEVQELACLLSVLAQAPIPWPLVEQTLPEQDEEDLEDNRDELVSLSLLQREAENVYQLHQLIHKFLRSKLEEKAQAESETLKRAVAQTLVNMAEQIPQDPTLEQIVEFNPAIPHLTEVAEVLTDWIADEDLVTPFTRLGFFYNGQGLYTQAEPWHKQCRDICQNRLGESHPSVAISFDNLASLYRLQGKYEEAEPLCKQALVIHKKLFGDSHPHVAINLNNLAELYRAQGRYEAAEPLYLEALQILFQRLGQDHPNSQQGWQNYLYFLQQVVSENRQSELSEVSLNILSQMQSQS
ncbi:MAG: tetratricopeptide repeat protein, partial [Microcoleaceae cyanobacterium]